LSPSQRKAADGRKHTPVFDHIHSSSKTCLAVDQLIWFIYSQTSYNPLVCLVRFCSMAPTQPYLYASPAYDYAFDPKVYSRSSLVLPSPVPLKPEGPLLDFNRHPDSYLVLPYGQTNATPLRPSTKRNVTTVRRFQLTLRIFQMLCILENLVAAICIRSIQYVESWVLRATVQYNWRPYKLHANWNSPLSIF